MLHNLTLKNNLIIRNSLLQPNDIHGNPNAFNVKSSVLGMSHIQIDGWMNPAVQTTYDFIKKRISMRGRKLFNTVGIGKALC